MVNWTLLYWTKINHCGLSLSILYWRFIKVIAKRYMIKNRTYLIPSIKGIKIFVSLPKEVLNNNLSSHIGYQMLLFWVIKSFKCFYLKKNAIYAFIVFASKTFLPAHSNILHHFPKMLMDANRIRQALFKEPFNRLQKHEKKEKKITECKNSKLRMHLCNCSLSICRIWSWKGLQFFCNLYQWLANSVHRDTVCIMLPEARSLKWKLTLKQFTGFADSRIFPSHKFMRHNNHNNILFWQIFLSQQIVHTWISECFFFQSKIFIS